MDARDPELEARLKAVFKGCCFGGAIHGYAVCDSTMERAHALAREGAGEGMLVCSDSLQFERAAVLRDQIRALRAAYHFDDKPRKRASRSRA